MEKSRRRLPRSLLNKENGNCAAEEKKTKVSGKLLPLQFVKTIIRVHRCNNKQFSGNTLNLLRKLCGGRMLRTQRMYPFEFFPAVCYSSLVHLGNKSPAASSERRGARYRTGEARRQAWRDKINRRKRKTMNKGRKGEGKGKVRGEKGKGTHIRTRPSVVHGNCSKRMQRWGDSLPNAGNPTHQVDSAHLRADLLIKDGTFRGRGTNSDPNPPPKNTLSLADLSDVIYRPSRVTLIAGPP
ncbi:hypothetical protein E2C01_004172 [Portunus trituberculatus]|uniref:Uncharacterized protein n=1 Tax=Portunus trituberculatus TaxID=210409 RepID=A0A5B7CQN8_PORTR|nr:hypothetical protein [Portunus trituberculatus]